VAPQVAQTPSVAQGRKHSFTKTGNPTLDELLSQTIADIPPEQGFQVANQDDVMGELKRIGDTERLNFSDMFQPKPAEITIDNSSKMNMLKSIVGAGNNMDIPSALDVPDSINPIGGALKKDFRSMMKSIDRIKDGMRGGGMMPMPQIDPNEWRKLDNAEG
jgi:hypothetical protein